jgi:hypothetical protein
MRGHAYIGIDLDETYLDLTKRRIEASAPVGAAVGAAARRETAPGRAEAAPAASKLRVVPAAAGL